MIHEVYVKGAVYSDKHKSIANLRSFQLNQYFHNTEATSNIVPGVCI